MTHPARYNMSTVDRGLFAVTVWRDGVQIAIALLPATRAAEALARDFCARQNQAPDPAREAEFVQRAEALRRRTLRNGARVRGAA